VEIIRHAARLYFRFCLSFRDVEELLLERGVVVTYEAIRKGCLNLVSTLRISFVAAVRGPVTSGTSMRVRHERTARVLECDAVPKMRVGPSEPACRSRLQTTSSCSGQEPLW
jgi:hypothetical protein